MVHDGTFTSDERVRLRVVLETQFTPAEHAYLLKLIERDKRIGWLVKGIAVVCAYVTGLVAAAIAIWPAISFLFGAASSPHGG